MHGSRHRQSVTKPPVPEIQSTWLGTNKESGSEFFKAFLIVNSLRVYIEQLRLFLAGNLSYHVFVIAESWLEAVIDSRFIQIDDYTMI